MTRLNTPPISGSKPAVISARPLRWRISLRENQTALSAMMQYMARYSRPEALITLPMASLAEVLARYGISAMGGMKPSIAMAQPGVLWATLIRPNSRGISLSRAMAYRIRLG